MKLVTLLLTLAAPTLAQVGTSPATTPTATITILPTSTPTSRPPDCATCGMARPLQHSKQWETDHQFAHHLVGVLLGIEARRVTMDAGELRQVFDLFKQQIEAQKHRNPQSAAYLLLDEALKTIEMLVLRLERVEGELKRTEQ